MTSPDHPLPPLRVLLVDDEATIRATLSICLESDGHLVTPCESAPAALAELARQPFDLVFLDMRLGTDDGLDLIPHVRRECPWAKVVVITAYASVETAVEAMKRGAADYLAKPFTPAEVGMVTRKVAERRQLEWQVAELREALGGADPDADLPTANTAFRQALDLARQVAASNASILICGEVGTGKARLARAMHAWSPRRDAPFGTCACAADAGADEALAIELFGTRGTAADATVADEPGRVAFCAGGTLLLDEVGQLPPSLQPKVARLITQREYERPPDFRPRRADVRVIATTSEDLTAAVTRGRFRPDLFMALDVVRIDLPPLRERPEDVRLLAERYLAFYGKANRRTVAGFTRDAMGILLKHAWPGNARELRNLVERAVLLCTGELVGAEHLPPNLLARPTSYAIGDLVPLEEIEDSHIRGVLATAGSVKGAAAILGINASTLNRWLKRNPRAVAAPDAGA